MQSEVAGKCGELYNETEAHSDRHCSRFLLLLECVDDGVDGLAEQAGGFFTNR